MTSVGRWSSATTQAMVKDFPLPVTPSSVWWGTPSRIPRTSSEIARGWSPRGSNSLRSSKRSPLTGASSAAPRACPRSRRPRPPAHRGCDPPRPSPCPCGPPRASPPARRCADRSPARPPEASAVARSSPSHSSNSRSSARRSAGESSSVPRHLPGHGEGLRSVQIVAKRVAEAVAVGRDPLRVRLTLGIPHQGGAGEQAPVARCGRLHGVVGEGLLLAVVGLQKEVAVGQRRRARRPPGLPADRRCRATSTSSAPRKSMNSSCIQTCTHGCTPKAHSLWAISLVWCTVR